MITAPDLQLVLHPGALRQLQHHRPQVGAAQPAQRDLLGQSEDVAGRGAGEKLKAEGRLADARLAKAEARAKARVAASS